MPDDIMNEPLGKDPNSNNTQKDTTDNDLFEKFTKDKFNEFLHMTDAELSKKQDSLFSQVIKETEPNSNFTNKETPENKSSEMTEEELEKLGEYIANLEPTAD